MKCAVCKTPSLETVLLANDLIGHRCSSCGGTFIASMDYWSWLKNQSMDEKWPDFSEKPEISVIGVNQLKICPGCGHVLRRYKIWPDIDFFVDNCSTCNGVWMDANEWETIEKNGLHSKINLFFTEPWQRRVHSVETKLHLEAIYQERFGPENYGRLKEIRAWIHDHKEQGAMLAFLSSEDPYKV